MIVCLYESDYPVVKNEEPNWQGLPIGYFQCDRRRLRAIETKETLVLSGTFVSAENVIRPRNGEHVLAVFSYKRERYLYVATLSWNWTNLGRKQKWWAHLGLPRARLIKKW